MSVAQKKIDAAEYILRQSVYSTEGLVYHKAFTALVKLPWAALEAIHNCVLWHVSEAGDNQLAVEKILGRVVEAK